MREIKFRAWCKSNKKMIYFNPDKVDQYTATQFYNLIHGKDDSDVMMQTTSLTDIHGTDIYEGDILKWVDSDGEEMETSVVFNRGHLFTVNYNYTIDAYAPVEIIGNIYEV